MVTNNSIVNNVRSIDSGNALHKIAQLQPIRYDMKESFYDNRAIKDTSRLKRIMKDSKNKAGFIAQNMKRPFPELVSYEKRSVLHTVNTLGIMPYLVKALQSQQKAIQNLKRK